MHYLVFLRCVVLQVSQAYIESGIAIYGFMTPAKADVGQGPPLVFGPNNAVKSVLETMLFGSAAVRQSLMGIIQ